jgi:hypothetical protein
MRLHDIIVPQILLLVGNPAICGISPVWAKTIWLTEVPPPGWTSFGRPMLPVALFLQHHGQQCAIPNWHATQSGGLFSQATVDLGRTF